jgi:hypothetical protein
MLSTKIFEPGCGSGAAQAEHYGEGVVHARVPSHLATLEDEFPSGEQHYTMPVSRLRPHHIVN